MRDVVIDETMEDMDKDKDGYVTIDEYLSKCPRVTASLLGAGLSPASLSSPDDLWPQYEREQAGEEPDWVSSEREQFTNYRDKDKDGKLNKREIADWVLPEDFDHAKAESKHLIYEADINKASETVFVECSEPQIVYPNVIGINFTNNTNKA